MKFLLAHFIVVPLIIFTVPPLKGMTVDGASSCKELYDNGMTNSKYYNITTPQGVKTVYCEMSATYCGDTNDKGWMRVAYIDPTDSEYNCSDWELTYNKAGTIVLSVEYCTRSWALPVINDCSTIKVPTHGTPYTKVCGQAEGYQLGFTRAFHSNKYAHKGLNSSYVSGLSVTRGQGSDLEHIWTFAAGFSQDYGYATVNCPCAYYPDPNPPAFMGENYFCESGNPNNSRRGIYIEDPLWDSERCHPRSSCCNRGGPWFTATLSQEARDDIEVRICRYPLYTNIEDIGIKKLEIYIK